MYKDKRQATGVAWPVEMDKRNVTLKARPYSDAVLWPAGALLLDKGEHAGRVSVTDRVLDPTANVQRCRGSQHGPGRILAAQSLLTTTTKPCSLVITMEAVSTLLLLGEPWAGHLAVHISSLQLTPHVNALVLGAWVYILPILSLGLTYLPPPPAAAGNRNSQVSINLSAWTSSQAVQPLHLRHTPSQSHNCNCNCLHRNLTTP